MKIIDLDELKNRNHSEIKIRLPQWEYLLEHFNDWDYSKCKEPNRLDYRRPDNLSGDQQRTYIVGACIREHVEKGEVGIDIGGGNAPSPFCVSVDYCEGVSPDYGGDGYYPHLVCDGATLPFSNNSFQWLVACHALEHFSDTLITLKEWIRITKRGGHIYIVMPDAQYAGTEDFSHKQIYTPDEFEIKVLDKVRDLVEVEEYDTFKNNFSFPTMLRKL